VTQNPARESSPESPTSPTTADRDGPSIDRRVLLAAGGLAGASAAALLVAGCSSSGAGGGSSSAPASGSQPSGGGASSGSGASSGGAAAGGKALGPASAVPVGGGQVYAAEKVVVTQPTAGQFKAFSAICTHEGCTVNKVADGTIDCPCHGSQFRIQDGSVANGPAEDPLPARTVTDDGGTLRLS
jgi:Rieske Fe-S protein